MKMNKLLTLGVIAPMFAMCTSCVRGVSKINYKQALEFAMKHYDQYEDLGFSPTYNLKINKIALNDAKGYAKVVKDGAETFEQTYYVDTTISDLTTTIDTDEIKLPHVNSKTITTIEEYLPIVNGLLGYFDASYTLEDNKYLGIYAKSNKLEQVLGLAGVVSFFMEGSKESLPKYLAFLLELKGLSASYAGIKLTASCNNLGLLDRAHVALNIKDFSFHLDLEDERKVAFDVFVSEQVALDLELIVNYK